MGDKNNPNAFKFDGVKVDHALATLAFPEPISFTPSPERPTGSNARFETILAKVKDVKNDIKLVIRAVKFTTNKEALGDYAYDREEYADIRDVLFEALEIISDSNANLSGSSTPSSEMSTPMNSSAPSTPVNALYSPTDEEPVAEESTNEEQRPVIVVNEEILQLLKDENFLIQQAEKYHIDITVLSERQKVNLGFEFVRRYAWNQKYSMAEFEDDLRLVSYTFDRGVLVDNWLVERLSKFIRSIAINGKPYVIMKTNRSGRPHLLKDSTFVTSYSERRGYSYTQGKSHGWLFKLIERDALLKYNDYDFIPYNKWEPDPVIQEMIDSNAPTVAKYNGFQGYQAQPIAEEDVDPSLFQDILNHIYRVWANRNHDYYDWIMAWFAHLVTYPRLPLTMLTIIGAEGSGKTCIITEFLIKYIFGKDTGVQVDNIDDILVPFNSHLEGKSLIYIAELHSTDGGLYTKMNKLKSLITDPIIKITQKGLDTRFETNCSHYIASSNNDYCLRITDENRRHVVFRTNDEYRQDRAYFTRLRAAFNQESANHFYSYLYHNQKELLSKKDPTVVLLVPTDIMKTIIEMSLPPTLAFLKQLREGDHVLRVKESDSRIHLNKDLIVIEKSYMYDLFILWTRANGLGNPSSRTFYVALKDILDERRVGTVRCYACEKSWFELTKLEPFSLLTPL